VTEFDLMVDNITAISSSQVSLEGYMSNVEIWKRTLIALSNGVMSSNIANRIWLECCRYLTKKTVYVAADKKSAVSQKNAIDEWEKYCNKMSQK